MVKRIVVSAGLLVIVLVAACGNDDADTTTQPPSTTQAATTTTPATAVGDPERGRQIWEDGGGVIGAPGCSACHSVDGSENIGSLRAPTWQGISGRAGDRVAGLSAEEYLRQSIVDPTAYIVDGYFADSMPKGFKILLSEEDIDGLVAFLLTL